MKSISQIKHKIESGEYPLNFQSRPSAITSDKELIVICAFFISDIERQIEQTLKDYPYASQCNCVLRVNFFDIELRSKFFQNDQIVFDMIKEELIAAGYSIAKWGKFEWASFEGCCAFRIKINLYQLPEEQQDKLNYVDNTCDIVTSINHVFALIFVISTTIGAVCYCDKIYPKIPEIIFSTLGCISASSLAFTFISLWAGKCIFKKYECLEEQYVKNYTKE